MASALLKTLEACHITLTPIQFGLRVEVWAEVLDYAEVPADRINECYLHAMAKRHKTSFPLNVAEICEAWRDLNGTNNRERWMNKDQREDS